MWNGPEAQVRISKIQNPRSTTQIPISKTSQPRSQIPNIKDVVLLMRREELGDNFTGNLFDTKAETVDEVIETEDAVENQDHEDTQDVAQESSEKQKVT